MSDQFNSPEMGLNPEPLIQMFKDMNEYNLGIQVLNVFKRISTNYLQWDSLGKLYHSLKSYDNALDCLLCCSKQITHPDERYKLNTNFAKVYNNLNLPEEALKHIEENLNKNPKDYNMLLEQVFSFYLLNKKEESEQMLLNMLTLDNIPEETKIRINFNLGTHQIRRGLFLEGLEKFYIVGKSIGIWPEIDTPLTFWKGGVHFGKTIVVYAEGGIGDEFVNIRFLKNLQEMGMNPVWFSTKRNLYPIWNRNGFKTIDSLAQVPANSLYSASMGLPLYLKMKLENLWTGPYITPHPVYKETWKYIKRPQKLNIGFRWFGNPLYDQDLHRTIPIQPLLSSLKRGLSGVEFCLHSLQQETYPR